MRFVGWTFYRTYNVRVYSQLKKRYVIFEKDFEEAGDMVVFCILIFPFVVLAELMKMNK